MVELTGGRSVDFLDGGGVMGGAAESLAGGGLGAGAVGGGVAACAATGVSALATGLGGGGFTLVQAAVQTRAAIAASGASVGRCFIPVIRACYRSAAQRGQVTRWSLTRPVACMNA